MELSDKVRRVAFTLAVGSIGVAIGYATHEVVESIEKKRPEHMAETGYPPYIIQDYRSKSGISYFAGGFAF